ncbi:MAG: SDR family oxidoreductase [Thaumarchaeota archaeon]|nr:SDR family oxidoreductase [Nitrososphaerota archaeon]
MSSEKDPQPTGRRLENEVAIITGGNGGIGEVAALLFGREGARVAVHYSGLGDTSAARAAEVVKRLENLGAEAISIRANVSNYSEVTSAVEEVVNKWGKLSLLSCFAGLQGNTASWNEDPLELSDDDLLSAIRVDFLGSYHFIKACKDHMKKGGYGKVVVISSSPTINGEEAGFRFILAKDLNRIAVKSLAPKLIRDYGVYLNVIAPGTVETTANKKNYNEKQWEELMKWVPLGRAGKPEEIARVALFLSSHDSDFVVGQTIVVDGGEVRL